MPQHDMFHTVLQTIFSPKFKQIFNIYTRSSIVADRALNHARFRAAMHPAWCMADYGLKNLKQKLKFG
jgi:hypothetical protein